MRSFFSSSDIPLWRCSDVPFNCRPLLRQLAMILALQTEALSTRSEALMTSTGPGSMSGACLFVFIRQISCSP